MSYPPPDPEIDLAHERVKDIIASIPNENDRQYIQDALKVGVDYVISFLAVAGEARRALGPKAIVLEQGRRRVLGILLDDRNGNRREYEVEMDESGSWAARRTDRPVSPAPEDVSSCSEAFAWIAADAGIEAPPPEKPERTPSRVILAERVEQLRLERGWSMDRLNAEMVKQLGTANSHNFMADMFRDGRAEPGSRDFDAFAAIFDVEVADLVTRQGATP